MKIAYLIERLDPSRGGAETYSFDFTKKLAAEGHDLHVFTRAGSVVPAGVTLHPVPVRGIGRAWRTLSFARNVDRMLSKEKFDIVHGIGWTCSQDVFQPHGGVHRAMIICSRMRHGIIKGVATEFRQDFTIKECFYRLFEQAQYRKHSPVLFVALSDSVKQNMTDFYDVPDEKIEVVYNGVDTERFHPRNREIYRSALRRRHGIADDEVVLLIVAHNFALKGVPELVRCVTEEDFPPCRLLVVGAGKSKRLKRLAERRARGRVIFAGAVEDTAPYYAAADVYAHPTHYDPCSLVVLEALAAGLPVVTTMMNGAGELIQGGVEGFIAAPPYSKFERIERRLWQVGDIQVQFPTFSDGLRRLFDPKLRKRMGVAARALAEKHTLDDNVRAMIAVYDEILRLKGRA